MEGVGCPGCSLMIFFALRFELQRIMRETVCVRQEKEDQTSQKAWTQWLAKRNLRQWQTRMYAEKHVKWVRSDPRDGKKTFMIANGIAAECSANCFSEEATLSLLEQTRAMFSIGLRCMKLGYTFDGPLQDAPSLIDPSSQTHTREISRPACSSGIVYDIWTVLGAGDDDDPGGGDVVEPSDTSLQESILSIMR